MLFMLGVSMKKRRRRNFKNHDEQNYNGIEFSDNKKIFRQVLMIYDDYYYSGKKIMARITNSTKKDKKMDLARDIKQNKK